MRRPFVRACTTLRIAIWSYGTSFEDCSCNYDYKYRLFMIYGKNSATFVEC
ncbi:MAG: hypothetical protein J1F13_04440 [Prevotellaceae bacterium]|nr:hypothetical protein [Prevotellaceae bacterium]